MRNLLQVIAEMAELFNYEIHSVATLSFALKKGGTVRLHLSKLLITMSCVLVTEFYLFSVQILMNASLLLVDMVPPV